MRRAYIGGWLVWMILLVPLGVEVGARVIYAARSGDLGWLRYPGGGALAARMVGVEDQHLVTEQFGFLSHGLRDRFQFLEGLPVIPLNRLGYRGRSIEEPREARRRLVTLGGSSTFSAECPDGETWPDLLASVTTTQHGPGLLEVVNMGMMGYASAEMARVFQEQVVPHHPDLVLVSEGFNSLASIGVLDLRPGVAPPLRRWLWGRSLFYTVGFNTWRAWERGRRDPWTLVLERYLQDLQAMVELGQEEGVRVVFVLQPLLLEDEMDLEAVRQRVGEETATMLAAQSRRWGPQQRQMMEAVVVLGERLGVPVLDPRPALMQHPERSALFFDFIHLLPAGARVMAEELVRQVDTRYGGWDGLVKG